MKAVIQRSQKAQVVVNEKQVGSIERGLVLLIGVETMDEPSDADYLAAKILKLRIFSDENGLMNRSVEDTKGELLVISQFTLIADYKKGNRPSFINAARPEKASPLFDYFVEQLKKSGLKVETGLFGADMKVSLVNDGPVTIVMNSKTKE